MGRALPENSLLVKDVEEHDRKRKIVSPHDSRESMPVFVKLLFLTAFTMIVISFYRCVTASNVEDRRVLVNGRTCRIVTVPTERKCVFLNICRPMGYDEAVCPDP
jgi:hypothetical protein